MFHYLQFFLNLLFNQGKGMARRLSERNLNQLGSVLRPRVHTGLWPGESIASMKRKWKSELSVSIEPINNLLDFRFSLNKDWLGFILINGEVREMKCDKFSQEFLILLLRYNPTDRKTLQFHKLDYFIKQRVTFLTRGES